MRMMQALLGLTSVPKSIMTDKFEYGWNLERFPVADQSCQKVIVNFIKYKRSRSDLSSKTLDDFIKKQSA